MTSPWTLFLLPAALYLLWRGYRRLQLSIAKHPSLSGHAKMSRRAARLLPRYEFSGPNFFACDDAPEPIRRRRQRAFERLAARQDDAEARIASGLSDLNFVSRYRVPFPFAREVRAHLPGAAFVTESAGVALKSADGQWSDDLSGAYGVNLLGYDFYKACLEAAQARVGALGPVLGPYHPVVADNVERLRAISGMDEVSFHMSGTEAVMQAVRLARYHTRRRCVVTFCGAYHGWWDGVQPGIGNPTGSRDSYMLRELSPHTLRVLRTRRDIACVLVNPLQALHPNKPAPGDSTLIGNGRSAHFDREAYSEWLSSLRAVCTEADIPLIFDEVFVGFRLGYQGAQGYFGVQADMVTYGKTLGGGLPVGVLCGKSTLMQRYREDRPADICFARGTFNSHPLVMACMNEFLVRVSEPDARAALDNADHQWRTRFAALNERLREAQLPIRIAHMSSIATVLYDLPSRYNWMLQFYLRAQGLTLSWVGTGRFIFSHNYSDEDFERVSRKLLAAARAMQEDGWWWVPPGYSGSDLKRALVGETFRALWAGRGAAPAAPSASTSFEHASSGR